MRGKETRQEGSLGNAVPHSSPFTPHAVLFDLDGTLVDTAPDLGHAADCVRAEVGLPPLPAADYRPVASAGARGLLRVALGITPEHPDFPQRRDSFLAHYERHIIRASRLFAGMDETLRRFERDDLRWGVVTNKPAYLTKLLMDGLQLSARSACCYSPEPPLAAKPAPDMLYAAAKQLGLRAVDCLYVGDDKRDIDAGNAAGMKTLAVRWGYFGAGGPIEQWGAAVVIDHPAELLALT